MRRYALNHLFQYSRQAMIVRRSKQARLPFRVSNAWSCAATNPRTPILHRYRWINPARRTRLQSPDRRFPQTDSERSLWRFVARQRRKHPSGWIRYCVGLFRTFEPANLVKKAMRGQGFKDAFVVAYFNGKRISLGEAYAMLNQAGSDSPCDLCFRIP